VEIEPNEVGKIIGEDEDRHVDEKFYGHPVPHGYVERP
jgi:hypothetical protein